MINKKKNIMLLFSVLFSMTVIDNLSAYAQVNNGLTDEMIPVGGHTLPPNLFGGENSSKDNNVGVNSETSLSTKTNTNSVKPTSVKKPIADEDFRPNNTPVEPPIIVKNDKNQKKSSDTDNNRNNFGGRLPDFNNSSQQNNNQQYQQPEQVPNGMVSIVPLSEEERQAGFNKALENLLPPTDFIQNVRNKKDNLDRINALPVGPNLKPVTRAINLTLRPGEVPPVIHLMQGAVTTLTFSDVTGAPWYVSEVVTDKSSYDVTKGEASKDIKSNIVTIYPRTKYSTGKNMSIMLERASVPVILQLDTAMDSNTVDYRADIAIMQRGPNAKADFIAEGLAPAQDEDIQSFVDGLPPKGAKSLKTSSTSVEAWKFKGMMYIRTSLKLMAPIWNRKSHSNLSGDTVYVLNPVPNITLSTDGNLVSVMIKQ